SHAGQSSSAGNAAVAERTAADRADQMKMSEVSLIESFRHLCPADEYSVFIVKAKSSAIAPPSLVLL
ncbi:MAG TPA: hypothetical protein VLD40_06040, partial [Dissulfurispiraceae bacterium]|nr:hypothetical protein [Dissulfurispiraceae bacterium]